jgi:hypothetical protein
MPKNSKVYPLEVAECRLVLQEHFVYFVYFVLHEAVSSRGHSALCVSIGADMKSCV